MAKDIIAGLKKLEVNTDAHWTKEGSPMLSILAIYAGGKVTGEELEAAAPGFTRANAATYFAPQGENGAGGAVPPVPGATSEPAPGNVPPVPGSEQGAQGVAADGANAGDAGANADASGAEGANAGGDTNVVMELPKANDEDRTALQLEIADLQADLAQMAQAQDRLNSARTETQEKLDKLLIEQEKVESQFKGNEIQDYLRGQERLRQQKAEHMQNLAAAGISAKTLRDLLPKQAPIDAALKNTRRQR